MGGEAMVRPVPGEERHLDTVDGADRDRSRGRSVGSIDLDLAGVVEELVEPGSAEYTNHDATTL